MGKKFIGVKLDGEALQRINEITEKYPKLTKALLIDVAVNYITALPEEELTKLIGNYYLKRNKSKKPKKKAGT